MTQDRQVDLRFSVTMSHRAILAWVMKMVVIGKSEYSLFFADPASKICLLGAFSATESFPTQMQQCNTVYKHGTLQGAQTC